MSFSQSELLFEKVYLCFGLRAIAIHSKIPHIVYYVSVYVPYWTASVSLLLGKFTLHCVLIGCGQWNLVLKGMTHNKFRIFLI